MKHLIVYAHPNPKSFNHAILETLQGELLERGHEVRVRDLYKVGFNPVLSSYDFEMLSQGTVPPDIHEEQEHISWADVIITIYPVWWTGLPAMLKGYFDRVLTHGFAYAYGENGPEQLLKGKRGVFFTTQGNPREVYTASHMFDAMKKTTDEGIYAFTGIETIDHIFFTSVPSVDDEKRREYLDEVKSFVHTVF